MRQDPLKDDPLRPPLPKQATDVVPVIERPERVDLREDQIDPVRELVRYVENDWFQQLFPVRTRCYRCRADSPLVFLPLGVVAFNDQGLLHRIKRRGERDITKETVLEFAKIGWKFQLRKAYCPNCKGLGAI